LETTADYANDADVILKQKETKRAKIGFSGNAHFFGRLLARGYMDVPVPIAVKPLPDYRIRIKYSDGAEGEVDFSHLAGKGNKRDSARPAVSALPIRVIRAICGRLVFPRNWCPSVPIRG